jgi:aspartyl/glutamyl-tRNA(Asn/Gln) amidotransferase C subunit
MSEEITPEIFNHLVTLAALELDEKQAAYLRRELNQQLKAIHELEAIPLDADLKVTTHGVSYNQANSPALREDTWQPHPNPDEILAQAPQVEEHHIIVPDIPHEKLD